MALTGHTPASHSLLLGRVRKLERLLNSNPSESSCCERDCANHCSAVTQTALPPFVGHVFMTYSGNHEVREAFPFVTVNFKQLFTKEEKILI